MGFAKFYIGIHGQRHFFFPLHFTILYFFDSTASFNYIGSLIN